MVIVSAYKKPRGLKCAKIFTSQKVNIVHKGKEIASEKLYLVI